MRPRGIDWIAVAIVLLTGGSLATAGYLSGYRVGSSQHTPTPLATVSPTPSSPSPSPRSTPTADPSPLATSTPYASPVSCGFGDFPYPPGSWAVAASSPNAYAHHIYTSADQVASFYANGASQVAWHFTLSSHTGSQWRFRMIRAPACQGWLTVAADPAGGTLFEAVPDSN